jgi:hypothetical protein
VARALAASLAVFTGVLAILLIAVGQLGRVDSQTFVLAVACSAAAAGAALWRRLRA